MARVRNLGPVPPRRLAAFFLVTFLAAQAVPLGPAGAAKLVDYMTKAEKDKSIFSVPVRTPNQIGPVGVPVRPGISQPSRSSVEVKR